MQLEISDARISAGQTDNVQPEISDARINENSDDGVAIGQRPAAPLKRYGPKKRETLAAAPGRRQRASAGDQGTQSARKPKGKAACKKK